MKTFFIKVFGCQMNEYDSLKVKSILESLNLKEVKDPYQADIILVDTCTVRKKPENKALSFLGQFKKLKKEKNLILGIFGCVPQRIGKKIYEKMPYVDIIIGTFNYYLLPYYLEKVKKGKKVFEIWNSYKEDENKVSFYPSPPKGPISYVTIQIGCNRFCSYCIVPFVRGRERSKPISLILKEIDKTLEKYPFIKEIQLLGQNIDFYKCPETKMSFESALEEISNYAFKKGIKRVRFVTSHPAGFSKKLIDTLYNLKEIVMPYVHLPPQSGSNKILKLMKRGYTKEEYLEKIFYLKEKIKDVSISGDFIVGFPEETEKDFEETLSLVEKVKYDQGFVFAYNPRPYTYAAMFLKDNVSKEEKIKRLQILNSLISKIGYEKNKTFIGKETPVLITKREKQNQKYLYEGRNPQNKIVIFESEKKLDFDIYKVKIKEAYPYYLKGVLNV